VQGLAYGSGRQNSNVRKGKRFFLLPNIQTISKVYPAPYSVNIGALSWGVKRLTTHRNVEPRLWMSGGIPLLHQYGFMAWKGQLYFYLYLHSCDFNDFFTAEFIWGRSVGF